MSCTKCNTWNPDDKTYCWRCQAELPKPQPKVEKKARTFAGLPTWMWLAMALIFIASFFGQCFMLPVGQ